VLRDFEEYKADSELIRMELETNVAELELKLEESKRDYEGVIETLTSKLERSRNEAEQLESQLLKSKKETFDLKTKYDQVKRRFVSIENENDRLAEQLRFREEMMNDLQHKLETTLEQLTILQLESEEMKEQKEEIKQNMQKKLSEIQEKLLIKRVLTETKECQTEISYLHKDTDSPIRAGGVAAERSMNLNKSSFHSPMTKPLHQRAVSFNRNDSMSPPLMDSPLQQGMHSPSKEQMKGKRPKKDVTRFSIKNLMNKLDNKMQDLKGLFSNKKEENNPSIQTGEFRPFP